jgi:hypothetical protein
MSKYNMITPYPKSMVAVVIIHLSSQFIVICINSNIQESNLKIHYMPLKFIKYDMNYDQQH